MGKAGSLEELTSKCLSEAHTPSGDSNHYIAALMAVA